MNLFVEMLFIWTEISMEHNTEINRRLWEKWDDMTTALNDPFLQNIDFDVISESKDEFQKDYDALVQHLRNLRLSHGN